MDIQEKSIYKSKDIPRIVDKPVYPPPQFSNTIISFFKVSYATYNYKEYIVFVELALLHAYDSERINAIQNDNYSFYSKGYT